MHRDNVHILPTGKNSGNGQEPPMDITDRVINLEKTVSEINKSVIDIDKRLIKLETKSDFFATKSDVSDAKNSVIMWVVSAVLLAQLLPALLKKFGV